MKTEIPVIHLDGTVVESHRELVKRLRMEAAAGTIRVRLYRGPEEVGSEAFYTLSDGTVLHEVNGTAEDGSDYRTISLVVEEVEPDAQRRRLARDFEGTSSAART